MIQNHATGKKNRDGARKKFDRRKHDMELWDIYDENKQPTGSNELLTVKLRYKTE